MIFNVKNVSLILLKYRGAIQIYNYFIFNYICFILFVGLVLLRANVLEKKVNSCV